MAAVLERGLRHDGRDARRLAARRPAQARRGPPGQAAAGGPSRGPQRGLGAPGRAPRSTQGRPACRSGRRTGWRRRSPSTSSRPRSCRTSAARRRRSEALHLVQPLGPARARRLAGLRRLRRVPQVDRLPALARLRADHRRAAGGADPGHDQVLGRPVRGVDARGRWSRPRADRSSCHARPRPSTAARMRRATSTSTRTLRR